MQSAPGSYPYLAKAGILRMVLRRQFVPRLRILKGELLAMYEWASDRAGVLCWWVGVEGAARVQPHQDLDAASFEVTLKPHGIVAGVEDK